MSFVLTTGVGMEGSVFAIVESDVVAARSSYCEDELNLSPQWNLCKFGAKRGQLLNSSRTEAFEFLSCRN